MSTILTDSISVSQVLSKAQDLDLIFIRKGDRISEAIGVPQTDSDFTHIGLVISTESAPVIRNLVEGKKYILEIALFDNTLGALIRNLEDVPRSYQDKPTIAWAPLKSSPWKKSNYSAIRNGFKHMFKDTGHVNNSKSFFRHKFKTLLPVEKIADTDVFISPALKDKHSPFTSDEFVILLEQCGLIPSVIEPCEVNPIDLVRGNTKFGFEGIVAEVPLYVVADPAPPAETPAAETKPAEQSSSFLAAAPSS
jgi:hypothetical protein